jgi:NADH:ubiquinone reductase (H+-translocating)
MQRVVIIGAGFGGLWATRALAGAPVEITIIDRNNYHTFLPLLYQVGAAEIEPEQIAYPVRSILRKISGARFIRAGVREIDLGNKMVVTSDGKIEYDFLIVATGSITNYFGIPGAAQYSFPLKTLDEGIVLRNHILSCFERAAHEQDAANRKKLLTFAIVGSGPTGIEFSGALIELIKGPLAKDYPSLDFNRASVQVIDTASKVLQIFSLKLSDYTHKKLSDMGVKILLNSGVKKITCDGVYLDNGIFIPATTVIWTAGVRGDSLLNENIERAAGFRIKVLPTLQLPDHGNVYIVGDLASVEGAVLPMIAPVAIQQGVLAANNIIRQIKKLEPIPFRYKDRGAMVTIGRNSAVAQIKGWGFKGFTAWILWLSVHLLNLIGFRNKILVLINWAWDYLFFERAVRLILPACCDNPIGRPCVMEHDEYHKNE